MVRVAVLQQGDGAVFGDAVEAVKAAGAMAQEAFFVERSGETWLFLDASPWVIFPHVEDGIDGDFGEDGEKGGFVDFKETEAACEKGFCFVLGDFVLVVDASDLVV